MDGSFYGMKGLEKQCNGALAGVYPSKMTTATHGDICAFHCQTNITKRKSYHIAIGSEIPVEFAKLF